MNEILRQLHDRKSVRVYEDRPVAPEVKQAILEAAIQAPSAGNMALYTILDITDQELKDKLAVSCDHQPFIASLSFSSWSVMSRMVYRAMFPAEGA